MFWAIFTNFQQKMAMFLKNNADYFLFIINCILIKKRQQFQRNLKKIITLVPVQEEIKCSLIRHS
jgi:hypothetical protein